MASTIVDFQPVVTAAIEIAVPTLFAVLSWAVHKVGKLVATRIGISIDEATYQRLDEGLNKAINYGAVRAKELAATRASVDVKSETIAYAGAYAVEYFPSLLAHFDIKPETLTARLEARLAGNPTTADLVK